MPTTVWITKYVLTNGLRECEAIEIENGHAIVKWEGGLNNRSMFFGSDWHSTKEEAVADAEKR